MATDTDPAVARNHRDHICQRSRIAAGHYPPLVRQGANLAGALWDWAVSGFSMASDELQARRLETCRACEHFDASASRCRKCGCGAQPKAALETSRCPAGKW